MAEATSLSTQAALRGLLSQVDDIDANIQLGQDELSDVRSYALARLVEIQAAILAQIDFVVNDPTSGIIAHLPTVGPVGPQGPQGYQGIVGNTGQRGPQGDRGPAGAQGASGAVIGGGTGPQGNDGPQGLPGVQGPPGLTGAPGINGNAFSAAVSPVYRRGAYATPYAVTGDPTTWQMIGQSFVTGAQAGLCYITANLWIQTRPGVSDPSQRSGDYDFHIHIDSGSGNGSTVLGENHVNDYMGTAQIGFWYQMAPNTTYVITVVLGNNSSNVPLFIYEARLQVANFGFVFAGEY